MKPLMPFLSIFFVFSITEVFAQGNTESLVSHSGHSVALHDWNNKEIKQQLLYRINDNEWLIAFFKENEFLDTNQELDLAFTRQREKLLADQEGLYFFAENIVEVSTNENLDLDAFLEGRKFLKKEYKERLNDLAGKIEAKYLVNRLLYLSLMSKYKQIYQVSNA